jgi:hypothetical protein
MWLPGYFSIVGLYRAGDKAFQDLKALWEFLAINSKPGKSQ